MFGNADESLSSKDQMNEYDFEPDKLSESDDKATKKLFVAIKKERAVLKREMARKKRESKETTINLRSKIQDDSNKYTEELSYFSTSKHVSKEIRQAARRYCKKFDIDYKTIMKQIIHEKDYDTREFSL